MCSFFTCMNLTYVRFHRLYTVFLTFVFLLQRFSQQRYCFYTWRCLPQQPPAANHVRSNSSSESCRINNLCKCHRAQCRGRSLMSTHSTGSCWMWVWGLSRWASRRWCHSRIVNDFGLNSSPFALAALLRHLYDNPLSFVGASAFQNLSDLHSL